LDEVYGEASDVIFNFISILNKLGINADEIEQMAQ
jgi:phosphoribosyl-ATP pyrophosphohydrolase